MAFFFIPLLGGCGIWYLFVSVDAYESVEEGGEDDDGIRVDDGGGGELMLRLQICVEPFRSSVEHVH